MSNVPERNVVEWPLFARVSQTSSVGGGRGISHVEVYVGCKKV